MRTIIAASEEEEEEEEDTPERSVAGDSGAATGCRLTRVESQPCCQTARIKHYGARAESRAVTRRR